VRIALCQVTSAGSPAENLDLITEYTARAAEQGAELVVFPEAMMARFGVRLAPIAEPLDGPWASTVAEVAARHSVTIAAGMFTPAPDGRVFNTLLVTGGDRHLGYHKIHLFDAFGFAESDTVAPGDDTLVLDFGGVPVGFALCYDVRFPELFRKLADQGATAIVLPASWGAGSGKQEQWELLVRARALDCTSWLLACGQADPAESGIETRGTAPTGIGHSLVADPYGRVHRQLGAGPDLLVVDIDPDRTRVARTEIPVLANRRL
jgi:predicted amidohydrolase